jgi:hypothetical protein
MAEILPFTARKPPKGSALCRNGHHSWKVVNTDPFAVKRGELITRYRCSKCGVERTKGH